MRPRTDNRSGKTSPAPLEKHFREIVVGSGRSQEPYIIAFHYASDNVSSSPLGTLFGFFEVEIHDQDAAYIVNFLASVAKKEYFANPRRSAIESFETTLHKINVALAEIVKHGNISWLGHLHGALGITTQDTLHFSVTGEGEIYLAREDDLHSISTGLAENEGEPHPLKTFTEVASGKLYDGDLVFTLSPSVWSLFSPDDLRRSLNRLGPAGFEQFLRTALVNELSTAAITLITCMAPVELKKSASLPPKPAANLTNVWSDTPFLAARQSKTGATKTKNVAETKDESNDPIRQTAGHIYIQASPDEAFETTDNPWRERWEMFSHGFEEQVRSWNTALRKSSRRIGKESALAFAFLSTWTGQVGRTLNRRIRNLKRTWNDRRQKKAQEKEQAALLKVTEKMPQVRPAAEPREETIPSVASTIAHSDPTPPPREETNTFPPSSERVRRFFQRESRQEVTFGTEAKQLLAQWNERIMQLKSSILPTLEQTRRQLKHLTLWTERYPAALPSRFREFWDARSPKERWLCIGLVVALIIGTLASLNWSDKKVSPVETIVTSPVPESSAPVFPPANEPKATLLSTNRSILSLADGMRAIAFASVNNLPFLVTDRGIVNLATQESIATPEPIRLATAMDDLDLLFLLGTSNRLYNYSVTTKKFSENTLPLPAGTNIDALGAYLTYLYTLDQGAGTLHRFPRAEGGFDTPTRWLKETVALTEGGNMAVFENVALTLQNKEPALYSRGIRSTGTFAGTTTLVTTDALTFDQKTGDLLVLDRAQKRIIRWSNTGTLLAQYYQESWGTAETFTLSPDGTELLVSDQTSVTAWPIQ